MIRMHSARARRFAAGLFGLTLAVTGLGNAADAPSSAPPAKFDFTAWERIVVLQGGRPKPLDTKAGETVATITGRFSLTPKSPWTVMAGDVQDWKKLTADLKAATSPTTPMGRVRELLPASVLPALEAAKFNEEELRRERSGLVKKVLQLYRTHDQKLLGEGSPEDLRAMLEAEKSPDLKTFDRLVEVDRLLEIEGRAVAELVKGINLVLRRRDFTEKGFDASKLPAKPAGFDEGRDELKAEFAVTEFNRTVLSLALPEHVRPLVFAHPKEGRVTVEPRGYGGMELYVTWLLTWQGWDRPDVSGLMGGGREDLREAYEAVHKPDQWDRVPMFNARFQPLAPFARPEDIAVMSAEAVMDSRAIADLAAEIDRRQEEKQELLPLEEKGSELIRSMLSYRRHRSGFAFEAAPLLIDRRFDERGTERWLSMRSLMNDSLIPEGFTAKAEDVTSVREKFLAARTALLKRDPAGFNAASKDLAAGLRRMADSAREKFPTTQYLTDTQIDRELTYNRSKPFFWTCVIATAATVVLLISLGIASPLPYRFGYGLVIGAMGTIVYGTMLRVLISGRAPVTNLYETLIWASFVMSATGLIIAWVYRNRLVTMTTALVLALSTGFAHMLPIEFGSGIAPLQAVLNTQYWLIVHVMTIVASYGAFMLAWGLGNVGMGVYLVGAENKVDVKHLAMFCYRAIQIGVLLLGAGTILGGVWAADSWGRFWGWDPKEIGALVAFLGYVIILHARFVGLVKTFGLLAWSVLGFGGVVFAWYAVNFLLGVGLHAYAFGTGGREYFLGGTVANILFVIAADISRRFRAGRSTTVDRGSLSPLESRAVDDARAESGDEADDSDDRSAESDRAQASGSAVRVEPVSVR